MSTAQADSKVPQVMTPGWTTRKIRVVKPQEYVPHQTAMLLAETNW